MKENIIIFGCGDYYRNREQFIRERYNVVAYLDNDAKNIASIDNLPVCYPHDLCTLPKVPIIIMAGSMNFIDMYFQLRSLGVSSKHIHFGINLCPARTMTEKLLKKSGAYICPQDDRMAIVFKDKVFQFINEDEYKIGMRHLHEAYDPYVRWLAEMPVEQNGRAFGGEVGTPIDRYYIEHFLQKYSNRIYGDVMEVAESTYTYKFGHDINNAYKLHVEGSDGCIKGNLETGEGICENSVDCFICTQTLQFIYDIHTVMRNIYKLLRPGGTALITAHGISQIAMYSYRNWGEYWRFTDMSLRRLAEEVFDKNKINIVSYGNMKTAMCFLYGLCQENLKKEDFEQTDEMFQFVLGAVCIK